MTATLKTYLQHVVTRDGEVTHRHRDIGTALSVTLTDGNVVVRELELAADAKKNIWSFVKDVDEDFAALVIENLGTSIFDVQWLGDKFTSSTDATPLGTHECWNTMQCCPHLPVCLGSDAILVNDAPVDHVTDPGPIYHANEEDGKIYKVDVHNRDATNAQRLRITHIN